MEHDSGRADLSHLSHLGKMEDLVCEACWSKVFNSDALQAFWLGQRYDFEYKSSWQDIAQNADRRCNWCSFLKAVLPYPTDPSWPEEWTTDLDLTISLGEARINENVSPKGLNQCELDFGTEESPRDWHAELDLFTDPDNPAAHLITARPVQPDVNSTRAYSQIRQWLDRCQTHDECLPIPIAELPTRVIEVMPVDSPETPRLLNTPGMEGQYLTLSYCWGPRQDYVLTTGNLQSCREKLDMSKLSRTIRDAIEVTKRLGFKYLWVDALCIVQDTQEDKLRELSTMKWIYENSSLTIVAASAASAHDGFLGARTGPKRNTFRIPCRLGQDRFSVIKIQEHEQYDDMREPANKRAWTLQEQLLSPQLLIYASHTLQWQCRTMKCNLGDSYHAPNLSSIPQLPSIKLVSEVGFKIGDKGRQETTEDALHPILQHWMRIVISYSNRSATLHSDKLVALAGLAMYFSPILGPDYFSGLWGRLFLQQLCWQSPSNTIFLDHPPQYRAPSWSWASIDGPLYFRTYLPNSYQPYRCELVECKTTLKSTSLQHGEVTGGYLKLRAVLRKGLFHATKSQKITWQLMSHEQDPDDHGVLEKGRYWDSARGFADTVQDNVDSPILCLPMYTVVNVKVDKVGGLMLTASQGGLFRRTGRFIADRSDFARLTQQDVTII
jgi:hypothetical protein